jgi:hypothetical protein
MSQGITFTVTDDGHISVETFFERLRELWFSEDLITDHARSTHPDAEYWHWRRGRFADHRSVTFRHTGKTCWLYTHSAEDGGFAIGLPIMPSLKNIEETFNWMLEKGGTSGPYTKPECTVTGGSNGK